LFADGLGKNVKRNAKEPNSILFKPPPNKSLDEKGKGQSYHHLFKKNKK